MVAWRALPWNTERSPSPPLGLRAANKTHWRPPEYMAGGAMDCHTPKKNGPEGPWKEAGDPEGPPA